MMRNWRPIVRFLAYIIFGSLIAFLISLANLNGIFIKWVKAPGLPSRAVNLHGIDTVEIESGDLFQYRYASIPIGAYWEFVETYSPRQGDSLPLEACEALPDVSKFVTYYALCEPWGIGTVMYVMAIDDSGNVFTWTHRIGEGTDILHMLSPYFGGSVGFMLALGEIVNRKIKQRLKDKRTSG